MTKDQIFANVESLSAEQLYEYILTGIVNLDELKSTELLNANKRKIIQNKLDELRIADNNDWERYKYGAETDLREYISKYPNGIHVEEAKRKIDIIEIDRQRNQALKQEILSRITENPNSYTPGMIKNYILNGTINKSDLLGCGIPANLVNRLDNIQPPTLNLGQTPASIPTGYTEVYFWGNPGSGKTCALAAILSTADRLGYLDIASGPGYDYMTRLKNIFHNNEAILPPPSPVESTQYLPFVLRKGNDRPRSVSLIELSGEIFQCFYRKNSNLPLQSRQHQETFNSLMNFLNGPNRKIHFFFIDYEKENVTDHDGYKQSDYLSAASTFFKNNDIFKQTTDAIYLVITKSDLMPCEDNDVQKLYQKRLEYSKSHLRTHNFLAFINSLKSRLKQHGINGGKLTVEPFSLGKVYFQSICNFDQSTSEKIINILIERIKPARASILDVFNK